MKKKFFCLTAMLFLTFCAFAGEKSSEKPMLVVMEIEDGTGNFDQKSLSGATEYLRGQLISSNKFIVVAKNRQEKEMISMLRKESYKSCYDNKCHIALGKALSADTILTTRIDSVGKTYVITSALIDLETETTIKAAQKTFEITKHDYDGKVTEAESLLPVLHNIVAQITDKKISNLETSDFYGEYDYDTTVGGKMAGLLTAGSISMVIGFVVLAMGLWGEDETVCTSANGCDDRKSGEDYDEEVEKARKKLIIPGAVFTGIGTALFIPGITYAVWDKYTKGERAAGFMISFGALAAAGGGTMIGLNNGDDTMFYGGIATAAVGAGMLIGGITMAVLDAKARDLKGSKPRNTSFFVAPNKDGVYAQLGFSF